MIRFIRVWFRRQRLMYQQRLFLLGLSWATERLLIISRLPPEERSKKLVEFREYCDDLVYEKPDKFDEGINRAFAAFILNCR